MATTGIEAFHCTEDVRTWLRFANSIPAAEHHLYHQMEQPSYKPQHNVTGAVIMMLKQTVGWAKAVTQ